MKRIIIFMLTLLIFSMSFVNVFAADESIIVDIPFTVENASGIVVIESVEDAPLPEQTEYSNTESGIFSIKYTEPLSYIYKIHQLPIQTDKIIYDETSYIVMVSVLRNEENDSLYAIVTVSKENDNEKLDNIEFKNMIEKDKPTTTPTNPDIPQTGDNSNIWIWVTIMGISIVGIVVIFIVSRKKETKDKK